MVIGHSLYRNNVAFRYAIICQRTEYIHFSSAQLYTIELKLYQFRTFSSFHKKANLMCMCIHAHAHSSCWFCFLSMLFDRQFGSIISFRIYFLRECCPIQRRSNYRNSIVSILSRTPYCVHYCWLRGATSLVLVTSAAFRSPVHYSPCLSLNCRYSRLRWPSATAQY